MINLSSLNKGLVFHSRLSAENQKVGNELVTNGTFDTDIAGWTNTAGVSWNAGVASYSGSSGNFSQTILVSGVTYRYSVDWTRVSGSVQLYFGNVLADNLSAGSSGISEGIVTGDGTVFNAYSSSFSGTIDNVTIKPVLIADLTPYGNHAENYGVTFTTDRKGQADKAGDFDGVGATLYVDSTICSHSLCTVALWITPKDVSGAQYFFSGSGSGSNRMYLYMSGTTILLTRGTDSADTIGTIVDGEPTLVIVQWDASGPTLQGWINDVDSGSKAWVISGTGDIKPYIGSQNGSSGFTNCYVDEVWVWDRLLDSDERTTLLNSYKSNLVVS